MSKELQHWGILGQKWGIRRYQNEDGSLTEEGRRRYSTSYSTKRMSTSEARELRREYKAASKTLSNAELKEMIERMNLEKKFIELTGLKDVTKGEALKKKIMDKVGNAVFDKLWGIGESAIKNANIKIKTAFTDTLSDKD